MVESINPENKSFFILTMQGITFSHMVCIDENKTANNQISKGD